MAAESSLYAEVNAAWRAAMWSESGPRARALEMLELRGRQALAGLGLLGQKDGPLHTHVAVVCHGRFNKILLSSLLGRGIDKCGEIQQGNCCINVVDVDRFGGGRRGTTGDGGRPGLARPSERGRRGHRRHDRAYSSPSPDRPIESRAAKCYSSRYREGLQEGRR